MGVTLHEGLRFIVLDLSRNENPLPCGRGLGFSVSPVLLAVFPTPFPRGVWRNQPGRASWLSAYADYSCGSAPDSTASESRASGHGVTGFAFKPSHPGGRAPP